MPVLTNEHPSTPVFSRHETFPPRFGWLKKAFDAFTADADTFAREDAAVALGVGKNMAKAIRYWALAFKIGQDVVDKTTRARSIVPTTFGQNLLGNDGWDPYLEDPGSLWLLHWNLLKRPCLATTWEFAFNNFRHQEFTQDDLLSEISAHAKQSWVDSEFSSATLKNDVSCFTRMYCKDSGAKNVSEETIASPFSELDLLMRLNDGRHFSFHTGFKSTLPVEILTSSALEFADAVRTTEKSINVSHLVYNTGSPGLIFKLPESVVYAALEEVAEKRKDLSISQTSGMVQLQFTKEPSSIADEILNSYFTSRR